MPVVEISGLDWSSLVPEGHGIIHIRELICQCPLLGVIQCEDKMRTFYS